MIFIYEDGVPDIQLRTARVNGHVDGWSIGIGSYEDDEEEYEDELVFESSEALLAFGNRLSVLFTREGIWP